MSKRPKRPRDLNQWAKRMLDLVTGEVQDEPESSAAARGRKGGLKGGAARAKSLDPKRRREIAQKAAKTRWKD